MAPFGRHGLAKPSIWRCSKDQLPVASDFEPYGTPLTPANFYLEQPGLKHLEDGVLRVGDAGLAAVAALVDRVVLRLALGTRDAAGVRLFGLFNFSRVLLIFPLQPRLESHK